MTKIEIENDRAVIVVDLWEYGVNAVLRLTPQAAEKLAMRLLRDRDDAELIQRVDTQGAGSK